MRRTEQPRVELRYARGPEGGPSRLAYGRRMGFTDDLLQPRELQRLQGDEELGDGQSVLDFWRWALGDLRMNTARGYLVEYLVAKALNDKSPVRVEWGPYDVEAAGGTRDEIKTAGYLQSWATKKISHRHGLSTASQLTRCGPRSSRPICPYHQPTESTCGSSRSRHVKTWTHMTRFVRSSGDP